MEILRKNKYLPPKRPLLKLRPFVYKDVIRVSGRLGNAFLPFDNKHPLLLDPKDFLIHLIIERVHYSDTLRSGSQMTLGTLRQNYWVVRGRNAVKRVLNKCFKCKRYGNHQCTQLMGNYPAAQVTASLLFVSTGVDYAGPICVKLLKSRGNTTLKGYIAIFKCFSTRAAHLELVEDYSSAAFIGAFYRFTARRGHGAHLFCDQGTTFVGADRKIQELFDGSSRQFKGVINSLGSLPTEWHFNPPGAPHFGGLWKAAVKSIK